jgi:hypothetical protein
MKNTLLIFMLFSLSCFAEQKFKPGEDENNYTRKESVQYLKNLLATDPSFRAVYIKAKDCTKKRDFKCLFDPLNKNKLETDMNGGYDSRNLEILERKLNCKQYGQETAFVVNPTPEQSKRNEQSNKCAAEVAKAYAAHDFTPPLGSI